MEEKKSVSCQHNHSGEGSGFLLGVIVGSLVTLVLTTHKGREIYRDLSEKGLARWSELEKVIKEVEEQGIYDEVDDEPVDYVEPAEKKEIRQLATKEVKTSVKQQDEQATHQPAVKPQEKVPEKSIAGRRWFRGLRKKAA